MVSKNPVPAKSRVEGRSKVGVYVALHLSLGLYSLGAVCSKMASTYPFLSTGCLLWYLGLLVVLVVYAVVWQQILRRLPLITAYANKGITILWGIIWGAIIFGESISATMVVGALIAGAGVLLVVTDHD